VVDKSKTKNSETDWTRITEQKCPKTEDCKEDSFRRNPMDMRKKNHNGDLGLCGSKTPKTRSFEIM
jgi:hypothetical protein